MAYQAKRSRKFIEDFELINENGEIVKTIHVELDADDMIAKINRKYSALCKAQAETVEIQRNFEQQEVMETALEKLGNAVISLFQGVFGVEDAEIIVQFYNGRYIEMVKEVVPFISQVVIPRCMEIKEQNRKSVLQSYNRKQRRGLLKNVR